MVYSRLEQQHFPCAHQMIIQPYLVVNTRKIATVTINCSPVQMITALSATKSGQLDSDFFVRLPVSMGVSVDGLESWILLARFWVRALGSLGREVRDHLQGVYYLSDSTGGKGRNYTYDYRCSHLEFLRHCCCTVCVTNNLGPSQHPSAIRPGSWKYILDSYPVSHWDLIMFISPTRYLNLLLEFLLIYWIGGRHVLETVYKMAVSMPR